MRKRLISALIALIIVVPLIILGGIPYQIGIGIFTILGFKEIIELIEKNNSIHILIKLLSYLSVVLLALCQDSILPCMCLIFLFIFLPLVFFKEETYNYETASKLFGSIILTGIIFYLLLTIRLGSIDEFIYLLLISILTDTFAYLGGNLIGKHKLLPRVSPNKTIEGSICGLIMGTIIPTIYYIYMVDPGISFILIILVTIVLSIVGQFGDLIFSAIKRNYKIKDFSNIMPGHGGIMDRLDSISFIMIAFTIIKMLIL